ncbi:ferritin-like domain-containing protein [Iamia sp. SCSIO 61187]|uniref:ferritin-like domain-containing protein n=1 Tax=Iamia sp. SCSIO 61187 TaxID=2722752 RepID=UPI001C635A58|nr:ferritin-like domain-containing protein [Iamia sp. SCSIO 61187]QYG93747.1 ferritin-like domain-containing protein [Iamia sp. SCSIO 61187]
MAEIHPDDVYPGHPAGASPAADAPIGLAAGDIDALVAEARRDATVATWRERATSVLARRRTAAGDGPEGRRDFLRLGATGVVAAAVLAACSDDESAPPSETGVTEPEPAETTLAPPQTTTPEDGALQDALVFRTARTMELAMVDVYDALLGGGGDLALPGEVTYDAGAEAALSLLRDRHQAHSEALVELISEAGGEPVSEPNNGIIEGVVTPQLADLTTQRSVLLFARTLEDVAAGTYGWGAGTLTTPALRASAMTIGAVAARQGVALSLLLDPSGADAAQGPVLDTSGPARLPEHMLVTDGMDGGDALAEPAAAGGEEEEGGEEAEDGGGDSPDEGADAGSPQEDGEG